MGSIKLELKDREVVDILTANVRALKSIYALPPDQGKERLWQYFQPIDAIETKRNDLEWLKIIVNWMPPNADKTRLEPLPLTETARWFGLITKINAIDAGENKTGAIIIKPSERDLIWARLKDARFQITEATNPAFVGFVTDFLEAAGLHWDIPEDKDE